MARLVGRSEKHARGDLYRPVELLGWCGAVAHIQQHRGRHAAPLIVVLAVANDELAQARRRAPVNTAKVVALRVASKHRAAGEPFCHRQGAPGPSGTPFGYYRR